LPAVEPSTYASWTALTMLDDSPSSGWAAESGHVKNNVFVFELANAAVTFERFELDTARIDGDGRGARHVVVEVSPTGKDAGFVEVGARRARRPRRWAAAGGDEEGRRTLGAADRRRQPR
jgi:hypothetical protein